MRQVESGRRYTPGVYSPQTWSVGQRQIRIRCSCVTRLECTDLRTGTRARALSARESSDVAPRAQRMSFPLPPPSLLRPREILRARIPFGIYLSAGRAFTGISVKLAPFKIRFSKMLKSRSSGDSRSNSVESEEQQQRQPVSNQSPSDTPLDEYADATDADKNCLPIRNEPTIPNSPPPSYEYVLEEVSAARKRYAYIYLSFSLSSERFYIYLGPISLRSLYPRMSVRVDVRKSNIDAHLDIISVAESFDNE